MIAAAAFRQDEPLRRPLRDAALVLAALAAAILVAWAMGNAWWLSFLARVAITATAALSLSYLIGQAGLVSFGHAAQVGLGAYVALIAGEYGVSDLTLLAPLAFATAALWSAITGALALRTRGVYFIMLTLAFAQMAYFIMQSLSRFGGDDGMALARRATLLGAPILKTDLGLALAALALLAAALIGFVWMTQTRYGLVLRAAKENESRALASGFRVFRFQLYAYALAGGVAALAGVLLANQAEFVSPSYMNWHRSGELIVMVVLGGATSLPGAVIGAAVVLIIEEALGHWTEFWKLGLGLVIVAAVLLRGAALSALLGRTRR